MRHGAIRPWRSESPGVGDDLFEIEFDRAAEALAFGARADRAVGGKQRRRRLREKRTAARTVEAAIEGVIGDRLHPPVIAHHGDHAGAPAAEIEGLLERFAHASRERRRSRWRRGRSRPSTVRCRSLDQDSADVALRGRRRARGNVAASGSESLALWMAAVSMASCLTFCASHPARRLALRARAVRRSRRLRRRRTADGIRSARGTRRPPRSSASRARRARGTGASPARRGRGPPRSRRCRA